ncbi:hypothetical protein ABZU86_25190, partial [Streptomyces sp. NPDC005271]
MTQQNRFVQRSRRSFRRWGVASAGAIAAAALVTGTPGTAWAASSTPSPQASSTECHQDHEDARQHDENGHDDHGQHDKGRHDQKSRHDDE